MPKLTDQPIAFPGPEPKFPKPSSLSSLSELDPYATAAAAAELGAASAWCGDAGKGVRTVGELPGTLSVPSRYHLAISSWDDSGGHHLRPLIPSRDDSGLNLRPLALYEIFLVIGSCFS